MPSLNHIHSYIRQHSLSHKTKSGKTYFKCADPACSHTAERSQIYDRALNSGKQTLCPKCKVEVFNLTWQDLVLAVPTCYKCSNSMVARKKRAAEEAIKHLLPSMEEVG